MYRIGHGVRSSRKHHISKTLLVAIVVLLALGNYLLMRFLDNTDTVSSTAPSITREYAPNENATDKLFEHPEFSMKLPNDWKLKEHLTTPNNVYSYQASAEHADNRWLDVYVDNLPVSKPVNRLYPVTVEDGKLLPYSGISGNCYNTSSNKSLVAQSFQGVSFQCDIDNYTRNVVGVGAPDHSTVLPLGTHRFMIIYTDHNAHPNYQILNNMLTSLKAK